MGRFSGHGVAEAEPLLVDAVGCDLLVALAEGEDAKPAKPEPLATSLRAKRALKELGQQGEDFKFFVGSASLGGLLFVAGAAPWALPMVFVLFTLTCLPWRAYSFITKGWVMFLIDFCYR